MTVFSATDRGCVRETNQDAVLSGQFEGGCWGVVCDGMGGANGGDIASTRAVNIIAGRLTAEINCGMSGAELRVLIERAVREANIGVYRQAFSDPMLSGMGTTVVCAVVIGSKLYVAHAGDSRAYLIGPERIKRITKDHSMVQELVDLERITEEEALRHPHRNLITRALGVAPEVAVDHAEYQLEDGNMVLLCSDGLTNCVGEEELLAMAGSIPPEELCGAYIEKAKENGGHDNITALIIVK